MERSKPRPMTIIVRPEVARFAVMMELKLRENDWKESWKHSSPEFLIRRLQQEYRELVDAVIYGDNPTPQHIAQEAADVANYAMMVADVRGGLELDADQSIRLNKRARPGVGELCDSWWTCPMCKCYYILNHFSFCPNCGRPIEWVAGEPGGPQWIEDEQVPGGDEP